MSKLTDCDSGEVASFIECEECNGRGFNPLWFGHGGNESDNGDYETCFTCGGLGEVELNG